ncbi:hypothetical protein F6455_08515 [Proteobacteria bacterium 005FR1]|nr:hypothetical protein [Proteobacteria bacterium 005FR1]
MKIVAKGLEFIAPAEVSPGWTRFQLDNRSEMLHFAVLQKMPEGIGIRQQQEQIAPVFQQGMNHLKDGDVDAAMAAFGNLPEWFGEIVFFGGPGLISPGQTATIYVHLEPGRYLLECYVKTGGIFHSYNPDKSAYGMVHEFYVPEGEDVTAKPEHTSTITLSSNNGIKIDGPITSGPQTIAVTYADQKTYEHFLGHDLHLAKLDESTGTSDLARWMNWMLPGGLETPAPVEFIAGVHEMPAGNTAYLEVDLEPGDYVWIAEVPDPAAKGMLKTFSVRN